MIIRSAKEWPRVYQALDRYRTHTEAAFPRAGVEVNWREAKAPRSLSQNAISHVWYQQVAEAEKEYTAEEVKRLCKYHFAIPILRANPEYSEMIDKILGPLEYEDRLKAMDYLRASSLMTRPQMSEYLENIQRHYSGRVPLEFSDEIPV